MAKKTILFYLSFGHGQDGDPGAVSGKFIERDIAEKIMDAAYKELLAYKGRTYKVAYPEKDGVGRSLSEHAQDTMRYKDKGYRVVAIDGHLNAGGGDGAEVWVKKAIGTKKNQGKILANYIIAELKKEGQNSRGIKYSNELYFLNACAGVPVLPEFGFVDNIKDRKGFDTDKELKEYGEALAKACIKYWKRYK